MLIPAIHFPGTCAEAIALYQKAFHAEVVHVSYYRDAPPDSSMHTTENGDQVMHAELVIAGTRVNMCDVDEKVVPDNMYLFNIFFDTVDEVAAAYRQIIEGGKIFTELGPQFWTPMYGDVEDCFGVHWQLMANQ